MRRRDPGYTSDAELAAAMAPFNRLPAHTPFDLPDTFIVRAFSCGRLRYHRMTFTPWARSRLLSHLRVNSDRADEALEWLELELRWAFEEERGFAVRYTHPQLVAALRALARCNPKAPPPVLSPALLAAVRANERISTRNAYLPDDLRPLPYCEATLEPMVKWTELGAVEVIRRADALYLAVRRRRPDNWEQLARRGQWEPLRQETLRLCAQLWVEKLECPASADKLLLAFALELLALVDPTFPQSPDNDLVESIRSRLAKAMKTHRHRPALAAFRASVFERGAGERR